MKIDINISYFEDDSEDKSKNGAKKYKKRDPVMIVKLIFKLTVMQKRKKNVKIFLWWNIFWKKILMKLKSEK